MRRFVALLLVLGLLSLGAQASATPKGRSLPASDRLESYVITGPVGTAQRLGEQDFDVVLIRSSDGTAETVDVTLDRRDFVKAVRLGYRPKLLRNEAGLTSLEAARVQAERGYRVWKRYGGDGGIAQELQTLAARHGSIAELVDLGNSLNGTPILALRVTQNAGTTGHGTRPAVLYSALQHAREWIAGEVTMRLLRHVLTRYGNDAEITSIVNSTELWFVPVANPDGYDFTFEEGNRLWRKNLRDNNDDGLITAGDGVDPNRNFPSHWGYDEEGSSSDPYSETYRGTGPASEPETVAMDGLLNDIPFAFQVNYHSYGALLLYPIGWQQNTETADHPIYLALSGDDQRPAIQGYDPDLGAELYITNGDTNDHAHGVYGTLSWTPELNEGCVGCGFVFPDNEGLIAAEFRRNLPFALDVAKSAATPDTPVSHLGNTTPDFVVDAFAISHAAEAQPVQVTAKRSLGEVEMHYQIDGGAVQSATATEWQDGERYEIAEERYDEHYARLRADVLNAPAGSRVRVWFSAENSTSEAFTYRVAADTGGEVLILAAEDYTGISPAQRVSAPKYLDEIEAAVEAAERTYDVYDIDANGRLAPHPLGVLGHYDAVIWYTGDDVIPREPKQNPGTAAKLALATERAVRDYLNAGGKVLHTGKYAGLAPGADGLYYYSDGERECLKPRSPCLPWFNDFLQYYLGAGIYVEDGGMSDAGTPFPLEGVNEFAGFASAFAGAGAANNHDHAAALVTTRSLQPESLGPFDGHSVLDWDRGEGAGPYDPFAGDWYAYSGMADVAYKRLTTTVDLTGATTGSLDLMASYDIETDWDYLVVEARTAGGSDWTTLPEAGGATTTSTGESCPEGWIELHPFLSHYQSASCTSGGTTGQWHGITGNSHGWRPLSFDFSAFAGRQVEVSITYITDWAVQNLGVFLDEVSVTVDGQEVSSTGFEDETLGDWAVTDAPAGSAQVPNTWTATQSGFDEGAGVSTADTLYYGFGFEGLPTDERHDLMQRSLDFLLGPSD